MEKSEAAAYLAGAKQVEGAEASAPTNLHVISGEVVEKSENGKVKVDLGGLVFNGDDEQSVEIATIGGLEVGDTATILLSGQEHRGMTPLGVGGVGTVDRIVERVSSIEADYVKTDVLEAQIANIDTLIADKADVDDLTAATARIDTLETTSAKVADLEAATARIGELEVDHVSVDDFTAEQAKITNLQTATADIDTIRANSAKVTNLTAQELEADHATVGQLDTTYATIGSLSAEQARVDNLLAGKASVTDLTAANGRIDNLQSTKADISVLESDYITANAIDATYLHADMSNADVAWIQNGVIKDGSISNAMINDVSANKLTAGTINGSVINVTNLNADNITAGTINGQRIGQGSLSLDKLSEDVYTEQEVDNKLATMQAEIDGAIETWTGTAVPTLNNSPASDWTTAAIRDTHVGDVYFVVNSQSEQNGYNYRFTKSGSTYSWQLIKDSDVTNALQRISTAEGKITTFDSDISTLKTDTGTLKTKTTNLETRMSDAEDDILDKVDTTTFNEVSDTVDQHSQTITQMSQTLSNKADGSTVTSLTQRVSKNEQDISGINTTIGELSTTVESKADGSTVQTISNKLNTVSDTVDGHTQSISSVTSTQSTMQATLDKTLVETTQLWFSKANTTAPSKPTSQVTSTSTAGNAWRVVVPAYNSSYPNYFYCYQWKYSDGTYGWSSVTRDIAMGEAQSTSRTADSNASTALSTANTANGNATTALSTANTANDNATTALSTANTANDNASTALGTANTANDNATTALDTANTANGNASTALSTANTAKATADKNVKSTTQLWFTKANETAPSKPTSKVTSTAVSGNGWRVVVPTYSSSYPYYFYCYQYELADGTYTWSDVVYDRATTENQSNSRSAVSGVSTLTSKTNTISDTVDGHTSQLSSITTTQTSIQGSAVKSTVQLWFTKANTTAPNKPTAHVTTNNASTANAWNLAVPTYNSSYPYYYYCYEHQLLNDTYTWSAVTRDIATEESQSTSRSAASAAAAADTKAGNAAAAAATADGKAVSAQNTADKNVRESQQLWYTKANSTAPAKPTSKVTSTATTGGAWTTRVPTYSASYSYYFYCMQYVAADGTVTWSDVVYDQATTEAQSVARAASADLNEFHQEYATFKQTTQQFESSIGDTYATKGALETVDGKVSSLTTRVSTAETNITQNTNNITLKAKKMETIDGNMLYDVDAPNLTKIFGPANRYFSDSGNSSFMVCDIRAVADSPATGIEYMAHWSVSGSSANKQRGLCFYSGNYIQFITGQKYIISCWVRCTSGKFTYCTQTYNTAFPASSGAMTIDSSVDSGWQFITTTVTATKTQLDRVYFLARTLSDSLAFECDMCGFKMVPAAYATQAELKIANDEIDARVEKNGVISAINLSGETAKIQASKVEIDGTAIFSAISSDVNDAITDKGYATTTQAQGYATTAENNAKNDTTNKLKSYSTTAQANDLYDAKGAAQVVQDNLDNLEIGGRNYVLNSSGTLVSGLGSADGSRKEYQPLNVGQSYMDIPHGTQVTISFDLYMTVNKANPTLLVYNTNNKGPKTFSTSTKVFTAAAGSVIDERVSVTGYIDDRTSPSSSDNFLEFYSSYGTSNWFSISNLKLEKGNKATDWTPAPEDLASASDAVEYIAGTQTAATGSWTGVTRDSSLYTGKTIAYKLPYAGSGNASLQLKDSSGNNVGGNIAVYSMTTRVTTHYPAGSVIQMTYDGTYWRTAGWYNTNNYDRNLHNNYVKAAANVVSGQLVCGTSAGYKPIAASVTFDMSYPILWAGGAWTSGTQYANAYEMYPSVNPATTATVQGIAVNKMVYVKGTISGNTFTCAASNFLTCTVPTSEDGYFYLPVGIVANDVTTKMYFNTSNDLYAYLDGKFRQVTPTEIVASHRIYWRSAASTKPTAPTTWIAEATQNTYDAWTTKIPPLSLDKASSTATKYLYLYTCEQRKRLDGTTQCTDVQLDENTTVIDGGNIITNSITAEKIQANSLTLGQINTDVQKDILNSNVQVGGRNLAKASDAVATPTTYNALDIYLSEPFEAEQTYVFQLWDVDVSHSAKSTAKLGIDVYYCGGTIKMSGWHGATYFTNGHADHLQLTLTPHESAQTDATGGSETTANSISGASSTTKKYIRLYNSVPSASGTMNLTVGKWKLEKGNKATDWTPAPEDVDESILSVSKDINDQIEPINEGITTLTNDVTDHENRLTSNEQAIANVQNMVNNLASTTSWLSFTAEQGLIIGDSASGDSYFYTQQKGSFMSFNQMSASGSTELMRLSGENGIEGPKVTVNEVNTDTVTIGDDWSITVSGDMFSINYIGN